MYKSVRTVYYLSMTTTTSNPAAIALIEDMIKTAHRDIATNEAILKGALDSLEQRVTGTRHALELNHHVDSNWLAEAAAKVEDRLSRRRALAEHLASLDYVLKAAGKD